MDQELYAFPSGSNYQHPIVIHNSLAGPHYHNAYPGNQSGIHVAAQNNLYLRAGQRNHLEMEELPEGDVAAPLFQQQPLYYSSVPTPPERIHVTNATRTHSVRAHVHPYASSASRSWTIRRRTPPLTQPEVVFNFNQEPTLVEDPMIRTSSVSAGHVPSSNELWTQPHTTAKTTPTTTTQYKRSRTPRQGLIASASASSNVDAAASFAQSSFPIGTPDFARKQVEMYNILTSQWKLNNELEPNADVLLQFAVKEGTFWTCAFYENGRRCERSMTDRSRQIIEHIRRHIKLEPYVCEGQSCPSSDNGCGKRYSSGDPLRKHRDGNLKGESTCELCGKTLLPGNIIRHRNTSCRETGH